MRIIAVAFCAGVCLLQLQAELTGPRALAAALLTLTATVAVVFPRLWRSGGGAGRLGGAGLIAIAAVAAGMGWAALRAEWRLADALDVAAEGVDLEVVGRVAELPQPLGDGVRFVFEPEPGPPGVPARVLLSWYAERAQAGSPPSVRAGELWRFRVRLRRPHGLANAGGFDYEAWLLQRGVRATGYVRGEATLLATPPQGLMHQVHRWRGEVRDRFGAALGDAPYAGILAALAVGEQRAIPPAQWEVFRRTGVAHLVSISGLHVSLLAMLAGGMVGWGWRRVPACALRWPAHKAAALAALGAGVAYALLAGMGIPVQRAAIMLAVAAAALIGGRALAPSRILALALLAVLVFDPWAVLAAGFWLSFGAVAVILFVLGGRAAGRGGWRGAVRIQLAITLAMVPALLLLFQSFPLLSPLANAVAIPLVSFVITPLVLLAVPLPFEELLLAAHAAATPMMHVLEGLARLDGAQWQQAAPPAWLVLAASVASAVLLLPRATPAKLAGVAVLAALLAWQPPRPLQGAFAATVLDVGQGLAVHVQTATRDLLFDAGPPYGGAADAGSRVVVPYLQARGVRRLDAMLLSHEDSDHVGGARSVLEALPVAAVLVGEAHAAPRWAQGPAAAADVRPCRAGEQWEWDGVRFELLHPAAADGARASGRHGNDRSCVLKVTAAAGALLLTGDVTAAAEAAVLGRFGAARLASTVVVSAHHGSRSSSSPPFVDATRPLAVVHSAGHRNPFGHPHAAVSARWAAVGARNLRTDRDGAIGLRFGATAGAGVEVQPWRRAHRRYWHGR